MPDTLGPEMLCTAGSGDHRRHEPLPIACMAVRGWTGQALLAPVPLDQCFDLCFDLRFHLDLCFDWTC